MLDDMEDRYSKLPVPQFLETALRQKEAFRVAPAILELSVSSLSLPVVFLQVSTMLSRGAKESRDNASGLSIDLNKGVTG